MDDLGHIRVLEALIFASAEPVKERLLKAHLPEDADFAGLLEKLRTQYADRGVTLVKIGEGWAFRTAPDLADALRIEKKVRRKFSRAATETLAIIAYHQPITRAEIEEIRGVTSSPGTLSLLLETGWIVPMGRKQVPGRPMLWGTGAAFLDHFGLPGLDALPGKKELKDAGLLDRWRLARDDENGTTAGPPQPATAQAETETQTETEKGTRLAVVSGGSGDVSSNPSGEVFEETSDAEGWNGTGSENLPDRHQEDSPEGETAFDEARARSGTG